MENENWQNYGFKENGELTCVRTLSGAIPEKTFFYTEEGQTKEVKDTGVIKLTKENIGQLSKVANGTEK